MKSTVEVVIHAPQAIVAAIFDDPRMFPCWMDELESVEPVGHDHGAAEPEFKLVPKKPSPGREFVARSVARDLPHWSHLSLDAASVSVSVEGTFVKESEESTKLISEEIFTFKGLAGKVMGLLGRGGIKSAHRKHMESFKHFAEVSRRGMRG